VDLVSRALIAREQAARMSESKPKKRYYRKRVDFFRLVEKIKLWPSRTGLLHGVKTFVEKGSYAELTTHCNKTFLVHNSKNSRAARWLRNKYAAGACKACRVPEWKLAKYSATLFNQHYGSDLETEENKNY
jgi:pyrrolysyl-tRNA synthetase-like protein